MRDSRLFERIRKWSGHPQNHGRQDTGQRVESVVLHLQKMLNSRQGTTLMDKAYGMPDFTEIAALFPDSLRDIERSIAETIERYEPRLSQVKVNFVSQDNQSLSLCFHIQGVMATGKEDMTVHLESSIDASGKTMIKG